MTDDHRLLLLTTLERQAEEVAGLVRGIPAEAVEHALKPDNWTPRQHLHHLRETEGRYLARLEGVLREGQFAPPLRQASEPPADESIASMLDGYTSARARELALLRGLPDASWAITFNHPTIWGDVTIEWWAERMVQHTAEHLDELWMLRQLAGLSPAALLGVQRLLYPA